MRLKCKVHFCSAQAVTMIAPRRTVLEDPVLFDAHAATTDPPPKRRQQKAPRRRKAAFVPPAPAYMYRTVRRRKEPVRAQKAQSSAEKAVLLRMWPVQLDPAPPVPTFSPTLPLPRPLLSKSDDVFYTLACDEYIRSPQFSRLDNIIDDIADGI